jgi:hypothetical protein
MNLGRHDACALPSLIACWKLRTSVGRVTLHVPCHLYLSQDGSYEPNLAVARRTSLPSLSHVGSYEPHLAVAQRTPCQFYRMLEVMNLTWPCHNACASPSLSHVGSYERYKKQFFFELRKMGFLLRNLDRIHKKLLLTHTFDSPWQQNASFSRI